MHRREKRLKYGENVSRNLTTAIRVALNGARLEVFHFVRVYNRTYARGMGPGKARLNSRKHGVSFADAVASLEDGGALTMGDHLSAGEERWITMGLDALGRVLVVVYTWRGESVRLISARKGDGA